MTKKLKETKIEKYYEAVGRRKTAVARVRIWHSGDKQEMIINDKKFVDYFPAKEMQDTITEPFAKSGIEFFLASVKVSGGGPKAQATAVRHGLSRALVSMIPDSKVTLKALGFLTRDPRMKERKKPGLKGARRAPQWSKR